MAIAQVEVNVEEILGRLQQSINKVVPGIEFALATDLSRAGLCIVDFRADGKIGFRIQNAYPTERLYSSVKFHLLQSAILFARVRRTDPELVGECAIWFGDYALVPSLAFCGNSASQILIPDPHFISTRGYQNLRGRNFRSSLKKWSDRDKRIYWNS